MKRLVEKSISIEKIRKDSKYEPMQVRFRENSDIEKFTFDGTKKYRSSRTIKRMKGKKESLIKEFVLIVFAVSLGAFLAYLSEKYISFASLIQ